MAMPRVPYLQPTLVIRGNVYTIRYRYGNRERALKHLMQWVSLDDMDFGMLEVSKMRDMMLFMEAKIET